MPNLKASIKDNRQTKKKTLFNSRMKRRLKDTVKELSTKMTEGNEDTAKGLLSRTYKMLDKAAKVNVIKKNTASRKKSRLAQKYNKVFNKETATNVEPTKKSS